MWFEFQLLLGTGVVVAALNHTVPKLCCAPGCAVPRLGYGMTLLTQLILVAAGPCVAIFLEVSQIFLQCTVLVVIPIALLHLVRPHVLFLPLDTVTDQSV